MRVTNRPGCVAVALALVLLSPLPAELSAQGARHILFEPGSVNA